MAFVLEELTDEQREQMGFARTLDDVRGLLLSRGLKHVRVWAFDKERDAYLIATMKGANLWKAELQWHNEAIHILAKKLVGLDVPEEVRKREEDKIGQHISIFFTVTELIIPEKLKDNLPEIKRLVKEGMETYGWLEARGYVEFSPQLEIRFPKFTKSRVKLRDFEITH